MSTEKSWQARISEATDRLAQSFVESISYDRRMYKQDIEGSIAHARMLCRAGLISREDLDAIIDGLGGIERDIEEGRFQFNEALEDIHMVIENALIDRIGDSARRLHTARSRNDQVALDVALWIRQVGAPSLSQELTDLIRSLVELAERSVDVVMPSYTHLQRAQPISAAAEALAWATMFGRDQARMGELVQNPRGLLEEGDDSPLGSGAIAGTSLGIDPAYTASLLEFRRPPINSIEATASRDRAVDLLYCMTMIAMHLSRWAEQWIIYMSTEFGFIRIADRYTTGSSMMPQKRNPDMLELIRGRCGNIYGDLVAMLTILKGLPIGYNRDLQEDKRILFRAYDTVCASLTMAAAIVGSADYVKANIEATLERGFGDATSLAEYLVTKGIPFRTAHQIVGALVARCESEGKTALSQLTLADFEKAVKESGSNAAIGPDLFDALGAEHVVQRYRSSGAAGGEPLRRQLENWRRRLGMA